MGGESQSIKTIKSTNRFEKVEIKNSTGFYNLVLSNVNMSEGRYGVLKDHTNALF